MGKIVFFDTETSGLPSDTAPIEYSGNPHILEQAHLTQLLDLEEQTPRVHQCYLAYPQARVDPFAFNAHGIVGRTLAERGWPPLQVVTDLVDELHSTQVLVGHNVLFDIRMLRIEAYRCGGPELLRELDAALELVEVRCTMELAKPIMRLPPTPAMIRAGRGNQYKPPNLREAYKFFNSLELQGAHGALADVRGCRSVYYGVVRWYANEGKPLPWLSHQATSDVVEAVEKIDPPPPIGVDSGGN